MNLNPAARHDPAKRVAAGAVYLVLSAVLFLVWLRLDVMILLLFALSTVVAGLVSLAVGWPRLRRELAEERADREHGPHDAPSPPRLTGR